MGLIATILLTILAIIFPPLAAFIQVGCSLHFFLNILLTVLGFLPGCIHALWLIWSNRTG